MMQKFEPYSTLFVRSPIMPLQALEEVLSSTQSIKAFFTQPLVSEALYLASPALWEEAQKAVNNSTLNVVQEKKILISLAKYAIRMCTRCVPFGLFAGINT